MSDGGPALVQYIATRLEHPVLPPIKTAALTIADRLSGVAVLFYGSMLRTGELDGVADFYVLTKATPERGAAALRARLLWPDVSYHEVTVDGQTIRAKVATMPIDLFAQAARGATLDTTIWARFVQRAALIWAATGAVQMCVVGAVASAAITSARFAAVIGPRSGAPSAFWKALFQETYQTELRFEKPGRELHILDFDAEHYDRLLPLAWAADGICFDNSTDGALSPRLDGERSACLFESWRVCAVAAKPLNIARLVKAAFTFEGATRYALWKIHRHTGIRVPVTPFRERHPILAAPGVLWRVWLATAAR